MITLENVILININFREGNKMELLQSQAPAEGELLENSAVRTFRHWSLDIGYYNFDIGY